MTKSATNIRQTHIVANPRLPNYFHSPKNSDYQKSIVGIIEFSTAQYFRTIFSNPAKSKLLQLVLTCGVFFLLQLLLVSESLGLLFVFLRFRASFCAASNFDLYGTTMRESEGGKKS